MQARVRSVPLDVLRVAGILAIIAGHVWDSPIVRQALFFWHVPIFFVLSGYLWNDNRSFRDEFKARWNTLGKPYIFWALLITVAFLPWSQRRHSFNLSEAWRIVIGGDYLGRPYSAFWFMSALFACVLTVRVLARWRWPVPVAAAIGVVTCWTAPSVVSALPLGIGVGIAAIVFILAGRTLRFFQDHEPPSVWLAVGVFLAAVAAIALDASRPPDWKAADLGAPGTGLVISTLLCCAMIIISERAFARLPSWSNNLISSLAATGTFVILSHSMLLWVLDAPESGGWPYFWIATSASWFAALLSAPLSFGKALGAARTAR